MLKDEFLYYLENQRQLVKMYNNKFIVIKDKTVIGSYDREDIALFETQKTHELGTFLIQKCTVGTGAYTQTYHSRVVFA
jgi:hypothetical protein